MSRIEAVIFDIGNVLVGWDPERLYDSVIGEDRRQRLFAEVDLDAMNLEVDRGADMKTMVYALAERHPDWSGEIRLWHDRWLDMFGPVFDHSVHLLRALRSRNIPVFALSNFGTATFDLARRHHPFLGEFDRSYISGHMGVLKPDPAIYERVEADCGILPGRLLFADDRPANIEAARIRGWQTHLFESPHRWAERLVAEGLLTEQEATP